MSEWDGTPWAGTAVADRSRLPALSGPPARAALIEGKAATGPGVGFLTYDTPLDLITGRRSPQKLMRRAQEAYHANPWIRLAEMTVTRRVVGLPWHLEDERDEEWPDPGPGPIQLVRTLLEKPQAALPIERRQQAVATRRGLMSITSRHVGLCGMSYWFLDQLDGLARTPLAILYINPARMWPAEDDAGNLVGWVLDPKDEQGRGGTPLRIEEVLPFYLDPPDWGNLGSGLYEAMMLKAQLTGLVDRHAGYVLATGGRLAGIVSPKAGVIEEEAFKALVREFRNVAEAPDAAKRTTILQGPTDFTPTAADPTKLALVELAKLNRDDILAGWQVPPTQAGVAQPGGLNSGEERKYDEAVLMQGAVHDRVAAIRETIQYQLLDRWQALGYTVELEIEEPEFDDRSPLFEMASKAQSLPLRNSERRELLGLEPFGDARDEDVWLPATYVVAYGAGSTAPTPPPAPEAATPPEGMQPPHEELVAGKASRREFLGLRRAVDTRWVPSVRRAVEGVLGEQRAAVVAKLRRTSAALLERHQADPDHWWSAVREDERMTGALRPLVASIAETVVGRTAELFAPGKADPFTDRVMDEVARRTGERIVGINRTTRDAVARAIAEGYAAGLSPAQVAELIAVLPAFDVARAELVARTESMFAYNTAALESYGQFGVEMVEAIDGDDDAECAARNGQVYPRDEAMGIEDHPNGTLDWIPLLGAA